MTSTLEGKGCSGKADKGGTDKLREWDSDNGERG